MPTLATNRKAYHKYEILKKYEAGIKLTGPEVKSAQSGQVNLDNSYIKILNHQPTLLNAYIAPYQKASHAQQDYNPYRTRKLLLHKEQITHLYEELKTTPRLTIVPLKLYTKNQLIKLEIGLARGKRKHEKRHAQREREIERQAQDEVFYSKNLTRGV